MVSVPIIPMEVETKLSEKSPQNVPSVEKPKAVLTTETFSFSNKKEGNEYDPQSTADMKRLQILREIYQTEQSYVNHLAVCIRVFLNPLLTNAKKQIIPQLSVAKMFLNIQKLFKLHCDFLRNFSGQNLTDVDVGKVFLAFFTETSSDEYQFYITNFDNSQAMVTEEMEKSANFKKYLQEASNKKDCTGLTLNSYLIMPVQRIPRYILLLTDLLNNTSASHPGIQDLKRALDKLKAVAEKLNEAKRTAENLAKLKAIQEALANIPKEFLLSHKECIHEGLVVEQRPKLGSRYIQLYLFSDIIIMCGFPKKKSNKAVKMAIESVIELNCLRVVGLPVDKSTGQCTLLLKWKELELEKEINICVSEDEAQNWMKVVKGAQAKIIAK